MGNERFIFWFWESLTTGWHAFKVKKHFYCLIICIYFLPYLLNDSQTIHSTIHFSKPLLCMTLICSDWSDWSIEFLQCCFVYNVTRETAILLLQKQHLVAKNELAFSFRPTWKSSFPRSARATSMLMFHVDVNMKRLGIRFKNDSFQWFRVDSFFWETITLYTVHCTFRFKTWQDVFIHLELCYTAWKVNFKNP